MKEDTTVLTYGTFDLFHVGHVRLLARLKNLGSRLIVGLSTDAFNEVKGKRTIIPFEQRKEILAACKYVDKIIPEDGWDQKVMDIKREGVDIFAMGDDWTGKFDFLEEHCNVIYIPRTQNISTTEVKALIKAQNQEHAQSLAHIAERIMDISKNIA